MTRVTVKTFCHFRETAIRSVEATSVLRLNSRWH